MTRGAAPSLITGCACASPPASPWLLRGSAPPAPKSRNEGETYDHRPPRPILPPRPAPPPCRHGLKSPRRRLSALLPRSTRACGRIICWGPVFGAHVTDWPSHEAKIARFWKGSILHLPGYEGSPMMAHRRAGDVEAGGIFRSGSACLTIRCGASWIRCKRRLGRRWRIASGKACAKGGLRISAARKAPSRNSPEKLTVTPRAVWDARTGRPRRG